MVPGEVHAPDDEVPEEEPADGDAAPAPDALLAGAAALLPDGAL